MYKQVHHYNQVNISNKKQSHYTTYTLNHSIPHLQCNIHFPHVLLYTFFYIFHYPTHTLYSNILDSYQYRCRNSFHTQLNILHMSSLVNIRQILQDTLRYNRFSISKSFNDMRNIFIVLKGRLNISRRVGFSIKSVIVGK